MADERVVEELTQRGPLWPRSTNGVSSAGTVMLRVPAEASLQEHLVQPPAPGNPGQNNPESRNE